MGRSMYTTRMTLVRQLSECVYISFDIPVSIVCAKLVFAEASVLLPRALLNNEKLVKTMHASIDLPIMQNP